LFANTVSRAVPPVFGPWAMIAEPAADDVPAFGHRPAAKKPDAGSRASTVTRRRPPVSHVGGSAISVSRDG
jgi:hypothetical protein